jgi:CRP-like cAMP-binding protein
MAEPATPDPPLDLSRCPLFSALPPDQLAYLTARIRHRSFAAATTIFNQEDPGNALAIVESGAVRISVVSDTRQQIVVAELGPGDTFGELSLIDGEPRSATATAVTEAEVALLYRDDFLAVIQANPAMYQTLLRSMAAVIRRTNRQLADVAMLDIHGRIARVLLALADRYGRAHPDGGILIDHSVTDRELARMAGLYAVEVERMLLSYEHDDIVNRRDGRLVLRRPEALDLIARHPEPRPVIV